MQLLNLTLKCYLLKLSRDEKPFWNPFQNSECPRIFRVTGANQKARKLLFTDLVNTNTNCFCFCCTGGVAEILRSVADARSTFHEYSRAHSMLILPKDRNKLKRVVKACSRFYACISSLLIKPELHSENWSYQCESTFVGYWIKFLLILLKDHPFIFIKLLITCNFTALY